MEEEFVPIGVAAEQAQYSYSMVQKLVKRGRVRTRSFFKRRLVNLQDVLNYHQEQDRLGMHKHTPRRYRQEAPDATPTA